MSTDIAFASFLPSVFSGYEADVLLCVVGLALLVYTFGAVPSMGVSSAGWYITDLSTFVESIEPPEVTLPDDESQVAISFEKLTSLFQFEPDLTEGYSPVTVNALKIFLKMRKSASYLFAHTSVTDEELEKLFLEGDEFSGIESLEYMFNNCITIHNLPWFDTSSAIYVSNMFCACIHLHVVPALDFRNVTRTTGLFASCSGLTHVWIKNIQATISLEASHALDKDNMYHIFGELIKGTGRTLTLHANLIENVLPTMYVKLIDITDEMRAEDDLIDKKLPFVKCESTDEGAMLITEYAALKNWTIA
jgi:hypothetical protein